MDDIPGGPSPTDPIARPLRRDAERNRRRILEAARVQVTEHGLALRYDELARAADVAVGTVYNRFPDKVDLIEALFHDQVEEVVGLAERALAVNDPWTALVGFMHDILALQVENRGLHQLLSGARAGVPLVASAWARISPVAGVLLERAQAAGVVRADADHSDIAMVPLMVGVVIERSRSIDPDLWRRPLAIILDGLRAGAPAALPLHPQGQEWFHRLLGAAPAPSATAEQVEPAS